MKGRMNNLYSKGNICLCILVGVLMVAILVLSAGIASSVVYAESNGDSNDLVREEGSLHDLYDVNIESTDSNENIYTDEKTEKIEASVMFEDTSRRTATEKHFKLSDGSYVANIFSYDIHYLEGDKYEEIDNRLIKDKDGKYKNQKNKLKVELSESYGNGAKSKVSVGDYSIAFRLLKQEISREKVAKVDNIVDSKAIKAGNEFKYDVNAQSTMHYYFADKNIELEHNLIGSSLKENIIVNKPLKDYVFEYEIEANNLKLVLTESGDIEALDKSGNSILTIPKGYMFDSAGARSNDVDYKLEEKDSKYLLYIIPNATWLNDSERVFPITIDPSVTVSNSSDFKSASTTTINDGTMCASADDFSFIDFNIPASVKKSVILSATLRFYGRIGGTATFQMWENPNEFNDDEPPTDGSAPYGDEGEEDDIYKNYYFSPNNTYDPYYKNELGPASPQFIVQLPFDITESVKNAVDFEDNDSYHGFAFNTLSGTVYLFNEDYSTGSYRPLVEIYYRNMVGLESYWDYDQYSIGNNDIFINTYNDEATVVHTDATVNVDTPIALQHVYMDRYSDANFNVDNVFTNFYLGYGWKLNYQQIIRHRNDFDFEYYDEDGTFHYFNKTATNEAKDEDGLGLTLSLVNGVFKMVDLNKNEKWFDYHGRLYKTVDKSAAIDKIVNIIYGNGNQGSTSQIPITKINDNDSHTFLFNYSESGYLTSITYKRADGQTTATTTFAYNDNCLSQITNDDGTYSQYEYDGQLNRVTNESGYAIKLISDRTGVTTSGLSNIPDMFKPETAKIRSIWHDFNPESETDDVHIQDNVYCHGLTFSITAKVGEQYFHYVSIEEYNHAVYGELERLANRIVSMQEYSNNPIIALILIETILELELKAIYLPYTEVEPYMEDCQEYFEHNFRIKKSYDAFGRLVSSYLDDYSFLSVDTEYLEDSSSVNNNKPSQQSSYVSNVISYGRNMSFEDGTANWTVSNSTSPYKYAQVSTKYASHGNNSLEMFISTPSYFMVEQAEPLANVSGRYTVSGRIRVENLLIPGISGSAYGAYLYLKDSADNICGQSEFVKATLLSDVKGFLPVSFTCNLNNNSGAKIGLAMKDCAGIVYFDQIQLSYTPYGAETDFNNAVNGAFIRDEGWSLWSSSTVYSATYNSEGACKAMSNDGTGSVNLYQTVAIENNTCDTTYGVSVWLKRDGRYYLKNADGFIGLNYRLFDVNMNAITSFVLKKIDLPFDTWYKLSNTFIAPLNAKYVEINIQTNLIEGTILVDNVSLVRGECVKYEYDKFGNNSSYSVGGSEYKYNVEGNNAKIAVNSVDKYGVAKDAYGNVLSSTDLTRKVKTTYAYDTKGRVTSSVFSTLDDSYKIGTTTTYTLNNLEESVTEVDSLGFQTISNAYAYSGLLKKTTFNDGSYVEYNYGTDSTFSACPATITVYSKTAGGATLTSVVYNYFTMADMTSGSNLCIHVGALKSAVMPNGTTYTYVYDKWGNVVEIKLNGVTQITNAYNSRGEIVSKTLANGHTELYTYDALNRLVGVVEQVNDTTVKSYSYEYSVKGDLIATYDDLNYYCYKQMADTGNRIAFSMQGSYQNIGSTKVGDFEFINEVQSDAYGDVQKSINIEVSAPTFYITASNTSVSGASTRTRSGLTETVAINGTTQITYTYNSPSLEYGRIIVEDNKLIKNSSYPNGVRFVYTRDLDGNITAITVSQYGTSANGVTYNAPYKFHTDSYEFDNGYVNLWDFEWMQRNQPSDAVQSFEKIEGEEDYNGVIIKDIIKVHQGSFYTAANGYHSLVNSAALRSGIKGDTITLWAKMLAVPNGSVYAPCLVYSDGSTSPYQAFAADLNWQLFTITVNKNKTAVALRLPWNYGTWLKIGNVSIYAEKNAWSTQWAKDHVSNQSYQVQTLPQEKISDGDFVTDIIKVHQASFFAGTFGGTDVYNSLVNPDLLANGGDCITLTYRARIDTLDSNWLNYYSQDVLNTRVRALRFRYSDNTFDYGSQTNIAYTTNWQSFSVTSAPGKKVVAVELAWNYSSWVRIGNIRVMAGNLGRLDDRLTGQTLYNGNYIDYGYDLLGRETGLEIKSAKHSAASILSETYSYLNGATSNGQTDTSYTITAKSIAYGSSNITYNYTYCMGRDNINTQASNPYNIRQIKEGNDLKVTYEYDLLGRLVREDNAYVNATITYTYDGAHAYDGNNNLLSKTIYPYSPNTATSSLSGGTTKSYEYENTTYKDRLTSYNGQSISYDAFGNPLSYLGKTLSWQGRKLTSLISGGVTKSFTYDVNGIRNSKTVGSTVTEYLYNGTQLLKETKGSDIIYYLYEQTGMIGLEINGTPYYYVRNLQGDVTKIIDGSGNVVVQYVYDSWGKVLSVTGTLASTVGAKNPIRYRGYYYDTESELYYLNSRYYDPETGRFISPDVVAEGGNLYTYCQNDPVNRSDDSGYLSAKWKQRLMKIAAGIVFAVGAVAVSVATGGAALPVIAGIVGGAALSGAIGGTIALIQGNDGKEAIIDGLVDGFMWSGFFSAASSTISAVRSAGTSYRYSSTKAANTATTTSENSVTKTGQMHHVITRKVERQMALNPNLIGINRSDYVVQAVDKAAHRGYQTWHREYDKQLLNFLADHRACTASEFKNFVNAIYRTPEMIARFGEYIPFK